MHHEFWGFVQTRLRPGSVVLVNSSVFEGTIESEGVDVIEVAAADLAIDLGNIMTASVVMTGALCKVTGLVSLDALEAAVPLCLPPYRAKHVPLNQKALRLGYDSVAETTEPAWPTNAGVSS